MNSDTVQLLKFLLSVPERWTHNIVEVREFSTPAEFDEFSCAGPDGLRLVIRRAVEFFGSNYYKNSVRIYDKKKLEESQYNDPWITLPNSYDLTAIKDELDSIVRLRSLEALVRNQLHKCGLSFNDFEAPSVNWSIEDVGNSEYRWCIISATIKGVYIRLRNDTCTAIEFRVDKESFVVTPNHQALWSTLDFIINKVSSKARAEKHLKDTQAFNELLKLISGETK